MGRVLIMRLVQALQDAGDLIERFRSTKGSDQDEIERKNRFCRVPGSRVIRAVRWPALLLLLPGLAGCEHSRAAAGRNDVNRSLSGTSTLVFKWVFDNAFEEWKVYTFTFETDQKETVCVKIGREPAADGAGKLQEVWIWVEPNKPCNLKPGSRLEERLLQLLQSCTIGPIENRDQLGNPSKARLDWLLTHLKGRELQWTSLPWP